MKLAIMQPYFFPYIGYFQLINAVDKFVIYDNIEYTKKGWINRNYFLLNDSKTLFTLPLKKDNDYLNVNQRYIADNASMLINKTIRQLEQAYKKAPFYSKAYPMVKACFLVKLENLFDFIFNSVCRVVEYLDIKTEIIISSNIDYNNELKAEKKIIKLCNKLGATKYLNPIGGIDLYDKNQFRDNKIELYFLKTNDIKYAQFSSSFIPSLSIIDILMFNSPERIKEMLNEYTLI